MKPERTVRARLVGLVGAGVGPSLTPALHMAEAAALGIPYVYRTLDLAGLGRPAEEIGGILDTARRMGYDALNLTHPVKQLALPYLDVVDPTAAALGAVNTVLFTGAGVRGHNTDTTGFATAFATGLPGAATDDVVLLGAGGAGAAVADALARLGTGHLVVVDRDADRAARLAEEVGTRRPQARVESAHADKLAVVLADADGLVHCTPTGMAEHPGLPFDAALLRPDLWVADIVYRPLNTALLQAARAAGCRTLDGGRMAVHQAADALTLITGVAPDADRMLRHFTTLAEGPVATA